MTTGASYQLVGGAGKLNVTYLLKRSDDSASVIASARILLRFALTVHVPLEPHSRRPR